MVEISILLLTYNQEKFVKRALESIVKQKIEVCYEIIILDDASTDGTPEILKEYKRKHPHNVTLCLRKINSGHPSKNIYYLLSKAKGKYLAFLEGDDYWIDDLKIQNQYDYLEQHRDYSACVSDVMVVDEKDEIIALQVYEKKENCIYTVQDLLQLKMPGMMASLFARNYFRSKSYPIIYKADKNMADITLFMLLVLKNPIYQMSGKMAAYRYVSAIGKNNFNSIHKENFYKNYNMLRYWIRLENYIGQHYKAEASIIPIKSAIIEASSKYSYAAMMDLICKSRNRFKLLLLYIVGKYLLDSHFVLDNTSYSNSWRQFRKKNGAVVLFGAGMAAEEYIDKYAWQDNIAFLVDNDAGKQNKSYKGFLVKDPKEILKYKDEVKVVITNKNNESSIENQLLNMGIQQYYCYCSMQSGRLRHVIANRILKKL